VVCCVADMTCGVTSLNLWYCMWYQLVRVTGAVFCDEEQGSLTLLCALEHQTFTFEFYLILCNNVSISRTIHTVVIPVYASMYMKYCSSGNHCVHPYCVA